MREWDHAHLVPQPNPTARKRTPLTGKAKKRVATTSLLKLRVGDVLHPATGEIRVTFF